MKKILMIALVLTGFTSAHADECNYQKEGKTESLTLNSLGKDGEIIQLRYLGPGTKRTYTQFATRENKNAFLKIREDKKVKLEMIMMMGGNHYSYTEGKTDMGLRCKRTP